MLYRIRINEKLIGGLLITFGLGGLLLNLRLDFDSVQHPKRINLSASLPAKMPPITSPLTPTTRGQGAATRQACRVLTVYDGDTLGCDLDGNGQIERPQEEVRMLGIDTPERSYSRKNPTYGTANPKDEPYAKVSSEWLERQIDGKTVYLAYDLRKRDRYGRTLAFVYSSATAKESLNQQAVAQGYAKMLFLGKNRLYEDDFRQAEQQARQAHRGIWGLPSHSTL